jgi:heterodisulfide reductase subunit C
MALLGMREEVLASEFVWLCSACHTCYERCPQDVHIPELMNAIRNIAVREGHVPVALRMQAELLSKHGRLYEITDYENKRRADQGLPQIKERAEDVRRILAREGRVPHYLADEEVRSETGRGEAATEVEP